jgi:hypothetical protein
VISISRTEMRPKMIALLFSFRERVSVLWGRDFSGEVWFKRERETLCDWNVTDGMVSEKKARDLKGRG